MFDEGDMFEIPLPDGQTAIGWILHISKRTKDAVGFVVFGIKGKFRDDYLDAIRRLDVLGPFYTHIANLADYDCKRLAHFPVSESHRMLTKRRVGDGLYVGDDYIGPVKGEEMNLVRPMQLMGMPLVFDAIVKAFG